MNARVETLADADAVASRARDLVLEALADARARGRAPVLALAGGSTPEKLYRLLATTPSTVEWRDVHIVFGDERAVPPDHVDSNHGMATRAWLHSGMVPAGNIHRMRGEAEDLDVEAQRLSAELDALCGPAGVDLLLLGMGDDAHTASLFPRTSAVSAEGRVVALHAGAPKHARLTITFAEIARARQVLVLVTGKAKAPVLERVLSGDVNVVDMPIQAALRLHPRCTLLTDVPLRAG